MKKTLTIILLSISLSGLSQTEKGDFVITPTIGWNTINYSYYPSDFEIFSAKLPIGFHKYLSDRFAIGVIIKPEYIYVQPYTSNQYYRSNWWVNIEPEARYNFSKTRFTPFVAGRIFSMGYESSFVDIPTIPAELRRINNFQFNTHLQIDIGVSYFIKERFGLQVKLIDVVTWDFKDVNVNFYLPINFGLQFIINNPRSEIESPR